MKIALPAELKKRVAAFKAEIEGRIERVESRRAEVAAETAQLEKELAEANAKIASLEDGAARSDEEAGKIMLLERRAKAIQTRLAKLHSETVELGILGGDGAILFTDVINHWRTRLTAELEEALKPFGVMESISSYVEGKSQAYESLREVGMTTMPKAVLDEHGNAVRMITWLGNALNGLPDLNRNEENVGKAA